MQRDFQNSLGRSREPAVQLDRDAVLRISISMRELLRTFLRKAAQSKEAGQALQAEMAEVHTLTWIANTGRIVGAMQLDRLRK